MRGVALDAILVTRMLVGIDSRKPRRLGDVGAVAREAGIPPRRPFRHQCIRIVRMLRERAMAGLAMDVAMMPGGLENEDIVMAFGAGGLTGEHRLVGANVVDRISAIVPERPEALRHKRIPNQEEGDDASDKESGGSKQVFPIAKLDVHSGHLAGCSRAQALRGTRTESTEFRDLETRLYRSLLGNPQRSY
jgi:hypothetical protein